MGGSGNQLLPLDQGSIARHPVLAVRHLKPAPLRKLLSQTRGGFSDFATFWQTNTRFSLEGPEVARQEEPEQPTRQIRKEYTEDRIMSTPRPVLNRRVRISKTGRPYVNVADLVKSELDRLKSEQDKKDQGSVIQQPNTNGNGNGADKNHRE